MSDIIAGAARRLADAGIENARGEARLLLAHALGVRRDDTLSDSIRVSPEQAAIFEGLVARRAAREPFAYITGRREFWGLDFAVGPGVLVPRPESETLIEAALRLTDRQARLAIGDLGTGSGALLIAALKEFPHAVGLGLESSRDALAYATRNGLAHDLSARAEMRLEDWSAAPPDSFDLIFSNPPYIPGAEIAALEPEVARHEPRAALDGGPDGLDAYRTLAVLLPRLLRDKGWAILEIGMGQAPALGPLFRDSGLKLIQIAPDLAGIARALVLEKA